MENKIISLLEKLDNLLDTDTFLNADKSSRFEDKLVDHDNYNVIKNLQQSVNYKLNNLIQCDPIN